MPTPVKGTPLKGTSLAAARGWSTRGVFRGSQVPDVIGGSGANVARALSRAMRHQGGAYIEMLPIMSELFRRSGTVSLKGKERDFRTMLLSFLNYMGTKTKKAFRATVSTWEVQPRFVVTRKRLPRTGRTAIPLNFEVGVAVGTIDMLYYLINYGTERQEDIVPRHKKWLQFFTPYTPKTAFGRLTAGAASRGSTLVRTARVDAEANRVAPRKFDEGVMKIIKPIFERELITLLGAVVQACGMAEVRREAPEQLKQPTVVQQALAAIKRNVAQKQDVWDNWTPTPKKQE
mgnify:CR=1 FL=1